MYKVFIKSDFKAVAEKLVFDSEQDAITTAKERKARFNKVTVYSGPKLVFMLSDEDEDEDEDDEEDFETFPL
jgi:hypothetical protein